MKKRKKPRDVTEPDVIISELAGVLETLEVIRKWVRESRTKFTTAEQSQLGPLLNLIDEEFDFVRRGVMARM